MNPCWRTPTEEQRERVRELCDRAREQCRAIKKHQAAYPHNAQAVQCEHRYVRDGACVVCHTEIESDDA